MQDGSLSSRFVIEKGDTSARRVPGVHARSLGHGCLWYVVTKNWPRIR